MNRRIRLVAMLLLGCSFAVGGLAGMALEEALGLDWFEFLDRENRAGRERLLAGIDLSEGQRRRVDEILERREERLEAYWERRLPEIQELTRQSYGEIRAVLSAGQRAVFDRRVAELEGSRAAGSAERRGP